MFFFFFFLRNSQTFVGISSMQQRDVGRSNTSNVISSFIVCSHRNRSALVRDLLSYNSLFVGQLYEDKSLAPRALDLISQLTSK